MNPQSYGAIKMAGHEIDWSQIAAQFVISELSVVNQRTFSQPTQYGRDMNVT